MKGRKSFSKDIKVKTYMVRHLGDVSKYMIAEIHIVNGGNCKNIDEDPFTYIENSGYCVVIPIVDNWLDTKNRAEYLTAERMITWWEIVDRRILIEKSGHYI